MASSANPSNAELRQRIGEALRDVPSVWTRHVHNGFEVIKGERMVLGFFDTSAEAHAHARKVHNDLLASAALYALVEPSESMIRRAIAAGWSGVIEGMEELEMEAGKSLFQAMIKEGLE